MMGLGLIQEIPELNSILVSLKAYLISSCEIKMEKKADDNEGFKSSICLIKNL